MENSRTIVKKRFHPLLWDGAIKRRRGNVFCFYRLISVIFNFLDAKLRWFQNKPYRMRLIYGEKREKQTKRIWMLIMGALYDYKVKYQQNSKSDWDEIYVTASKTNNLLCFERKEKEDMASFCYRCIPETINMFPARNLLKIDLFL